MTPGNAPTTVGLLGATILAAPSPVLTAGPATAETFVRLGDTPVTVFSTCTGTTNAEAMVAPLQEGSRVENGVRISVRFSSENHGNRCVLTATATWRNPDTGASGSEYITVASAADPASGGRYGNAGYNRANFWTGPGTVVVTVSTHPGSELQVTV
jgi:hypothetical protein